MLLFVTKASRDLHGCVSKALTLKEDLISNINYGLSGRISIIVNKLFVFLFM